MRNYLLALLFLSTLACRSARSGTAPQPGIPPGTVRINDTLFADRTEIANVHWREYLFWVHKFAPDSEKLMLPDSTLLEQLHVSSAGSFAGGWTLQDVYFRHPMYNNSPVVGISYDQAMAFCNWRSDRVNEAIDSGRWPKWKGGHVHYRLPTEAEWMLFAGGGLDTAAYPFGVQKTTGARGKPCYNAGNLPNWSTADQPFTYPVNGGCRNNFGLCQTIGNVAELVAERGVAKGGWYGLPLDSCRIGARQTYTAPQPWLGFRCVATVVRK